MALGNVAGPWAEHRGTAGPGWHARPTAEDASDPSASPKLELLWISLEQNWTGSINKALEPDLAHHPGCCLYFLAVLLLVLVPPRCWRAGHTAEAKCSETCWWPPEQNAQHKAASPAQPPPDVTGAEQALQHLAGFSQQTSKLFASVSKLGHVTEDLQTLRTNEMHGWVWTTGVRPGIWNPQACALTLCLGWGPDSPAASLASILGPVMVLLISLLVRYWLWNQSRRCRILLKNPPSDPSWSWVQNDCSVRHDDSCWQDGVFMSRDEISHME